MKTTTLFFSFPGVPTALPVGAQPAVKPVPTAAPQNGIVDTLIGLFYLSSSAVNKTRVERFFHNPQTPVDDSTEGVGIYSHTLSRDLRGLCLIYGVFILALTALSRKTPHPVPEFREEAASGAPLEDETEAANPV